MISFLGIGAQKSGTSWLYQKLKKHPCIAFPAGKEVHFWDKKLGMGIQGYRALFSAEAFSAKVCGEITPAYSILPTELIQECSVNFPNLRLIYILRNPIDRAWSSAKMEVGRAGMKMSEVSEQWFVEHFKSRGSLARGDYEACIRNWQAFYAREQFLICFFEELIKTPEMLLTKCFKHIGVCRDLYDWSVDLRDPVFRGIQAEIPPGLRYILSDIYRPKIDRLQAFLGVNLENWV